MEPAQTVTGSGMATLGKPAALPPLAGAGRLVTSRRVRYRDWSGTAVTVVMPTYNEAGNLPGMVAALMALPLPRLRLLIVDDDSPDGTGPLADRLADRYATGTDSPRIEVLHRDGKEGLGRAYEAGMRHALAAGAPYVLQMDADGSHPATAVCSLLETAHRSGAGLVVGSRYVRGASLSGGWGVHRRLLSSWGNAYARSILRVPLRDLTGGFNLWRADVLRTVGLTAEGGRSLRSAGYAFQVELKYRAARKGFEAVEVPIRFGERLRGSSKMSLAVQWEAALLPWRLLLAGR
ncbi:polyprenol monophosphomannose synthase [Streptomyces sp. YIM 98790]|uniref:polyprenol monophosphomannose synthase n=1 Tax=Streptomyces sp. YIM 98790 TaxID=2689077 RepID=UPI0028BE2449|nr:polyprenol monophosphomannose synthase [Streptomyces sp. YIM 98790]